MAASDDVRVGPPPREPPIDPAYWLPDVGHEHQLGSSPVSMSSLVDGQRLDCRRCTTCKYMARRWSGRCRTTRTHYPESEDAVRGADDPTVASDSAAAHKAPR